MKRTHTSRQPPAFLPLGTVVGPWRVVGWAGQGVYGAVYRAVRVGQEHAAPVALKVALHPRDPRFPHEVALLSRVEHPCIPRLIDAGEWLHPVGTRHPYIAMEWVDGVPLYDWAREHNPDAPQVLRILAQLASALQSLHSQGALHRDVKGDNVLVRRADSRPVLMDFGSGTYAGAPTLTPHILPPGTPAYRAPEAELFELRFARERLARYRAGPADDLYALGAMACRLVTGEYPQPGEPFKDETGTWQLESVVPPTALLDTRVDVRLRALILRMLSINPQQRGPTAELAEALRQAAEPTAPAPAPMSVRAAAPPLSTPRSHAHARSGGPWLAMAASLALAVAVWCSAPGHVPKDLAHAPSKAAGPGQPDAGPVGLGDSAASVSPEDMSKPPPSTRITEDTLPEPQPEQARPDAKGQCPHKRQIALNGACWAALKGQREDCDAADGQMFKDRCYVPVFPPGRKPTSKPAHPP